MAASDPRPCNIPLISLLAESEPWLIPHDCETHPLVLSFYVPAHLSEQVTQLVALSSSAPLTDVSRREGRHWKRHLRVMR